MKNYCKTLLALALCSVASSAGLAQSQPVELQFSPALHFVVFGDTRFHDASDTKPANPGVRKAIVEGVDKANPSFICMGGDIVYDGDKADDWKTWDSETAIWRQHNIPVYPALGNHDLHGDPKVSLKNYFQRFPDLRESRYYSVRASNTLEIMLDTSLEEMSGPQGEWLKNKLDHLPADVDFVFFVMHHPPYTSSSDDKKYGGGHSQRAPEQALAKMLEDRQQRTRARFVVFGSHVHNYERHEHGGITYFVTGGGGAHAYPIERDPSDPFQSTEINYHYLLVEVNHGTVKISMNRVQIGDDGTPTWTQPDMVSITAKPPAG